MSVFSKPSGKLDRKFRSIGLVESHRIVFIPYSIALIVPIRYVFY